jgi:putative spermidine/putrescine transport system substrate-binding protein
MSASPIRSKAIGDQAAKDLGFKVTMQNLDTSAAINRFISQPNTVDIAHLEGWQAKLAAKRGVIQGIEVKKIKEFDNILSIFTKGEIDGHKIPRCLLTRFEGLSGACGEYARPERSGEPHVGLSAALDR